MDEIKRKAASAWQAHYQHGYKEAIEADDISVYWNDGLPYNEYREADIAIKKSQFFDNKSLLEEHFGKSEEDAEAITEAKAEESKASSFLSGFGNGGIGGGQNVGDGDDGAATE